MDKISQVKQKTVKGLVALIARTGLLQVIAVVATFILTVFLDPAQFGVFAIVAAAVDILVYFSDIGLAGALIQKQDINEKDLATTFTIQQILSLTLLGLGFLAGSLVANIYSLSLAGIWLFRALLVSVFLSGLKTIPSVLLERKLDFIKVVTVQIAETLIFYGLAVFLAWKGFGVSSFSWAVLFRSVIGLIMIYILAPWRPRIGIDRISFKKLISFGMPFQLNSLLGLVKDRMLVAYYGAILSPVHVGYLQWAERWSLFPLRMVVDNVSKVTFPAYSRLQAERDHLVKAIEKSIFFTGLFIFPILIGLIVLAPTALEVIPKYNKWQPALLALGLFSINAMWSSISTTITNAFAAMGKININLKLMLMWTVLTWILTPLLMSKYGYNGVAAASALVASSSIIPMIILKRILPIRLFSNIWPQLINALIMGLIIRYVNLKLPFTIYSLLFTVLLGAILYGALLMVLMPKKLIAEIKSVWLLSSRAKPGTGRNLAKSRDLTE
ncbi:oligosaccharide flippase family protein [Candidatus Collierbacteria bacterium]|nr:oligosaccharide flippase family protein [Candidatus Collierbacteria bacterium]